MNDDVFQRMAEEIAALRRRVAALEHLELPDAKGAGVRRIANQAVPDAVYTAVSFDAEDWDTDDCWNSATPTRLYCNTAGVYVVSACVRWAVNALGVRVLRLYHGSTRIRENLQYASGNNVVQNLNAIFSLGFGDYLELVAYQNSGASLNLESDTGWLVGLAMMRIG